MGESAAVLSASSAAISLGISASLPWLRAGALGSWLDTALALVAGACFALLAALLVARILFADGDPGLGAGLAACVALVALAGGMGVAGAQLLLILGVAPLGIGAAALAHTSGPRTLPVAALVAPAAAAPLALVDPNELSLLLGDLLGHAFGAALLALLLGLALGGIALAVMRRRPAPMPVGAAALALALIAAGAAYARGQPGTHGDRLFVVLREQAAPAARGATHEERTRAVYDALVAHAERTQAGLRAELGARGVGFTPYYLMNALEINSDDPWLRAWLAARPEVDRVLNSPLLRPLPAPPDPGPPNTPAPDEPPWNIESVGAERVWRELGVTGAGIVVGQLDSGVDGGHPALRDGYRGRDGDDYHWLDPWGGSESPRDLGGHGTYTLGSAVGRGGIGVAPGAEWVGCVVLERNLGSPARYLDCLQFMLAPYPRGGDPFRAGEPGRAPHILNNSWGCPPEEGCDAEALRPAVEALRAAGIFVVASAGNEGPACGSVAAPIGTYDAVFSVGAADSHGRIASFSSRGPVAVDGSGRVKPDIAAPGVNVTSAWPGGGYDTSDGTSAAAPHVAGAVALMWSANPRLVGDIDATERILVETARPLAGGQAACGAAGNLGGAGLLDAYAAVQAAVAAR